MTTDLIIVETDSEDSDESEMWELPDGVLEAMANVSISSNGRVVDETVDGGSVSVPVQAQQPRPTPAARNSASARNQAAAGRNPARSRDTGTLAVATPLASAPLPRRPVGDGEQMHCSFYFPIWN